MPSLLYTEPAGNGYVVNAGLGQSLVEARLPAANVTGWSRVLLLETGLHLMREEVFTNYFCFCILTLSHFGHFHFRCLW
jgi:hypothetical protein